MAFNVDAALKDGYSEQEIAEYLGKQNKFNASAALKDGYSAKEIIDHLNKPTETGIIGQIGRGIAAYPSQTQETVGGGQALLGKALLRIAGENPVSSYLLNQGLANVQEAEKEQKAEAEPSDSFTDAWHKGLGTVLGKYLPYQIGQGLANAAETLAVTGVGTLVGAATPIPGGAEAGAVGSFIGKRLVQSGIKEAAKKVFDETLEREGKAAAKEAAAKFVAEQGAKTLTKEEGKALARQGAKSVGANAAIAAQAIGHGVGEVGSRAVENAKTPEEINMAKALPAAAVHAAADFIASKIGLSGLHGMSKSTENWLLDVGKNWLLTGTKELPPELLQTAMERFGASLPLADKNAVKDYINTVAGSYGMTAGPGVIGGTRTRLSANQAQVEEEEAPPQKEKEEKPVLPITPATTPTPTPTSTTKVAPLPSDTQAEVEKEMTQHGHTRENAEMIVRQRLREEQEATNVGQTIPPAGGVSTGVPSGAPAVNAAPTGAGAPAGNGVVSTEPNVGLPNAGEGQASTAVKETPEQIAKRNELLSKENMFMDEEPEGYAGPNPKAPDDANSWQNKNGSIHYNINAFLENGKSKVTELIDQEQSKNIALVFEDSQGNKGKIINVGFTRTGMPYWSAGDVSEQDIKTNLGENLFNSLGNAPIKNTTEYGALVDRIKNALLNKPTKKEEPSVAEAPAKQPVKETPTLEERIKAEDERNAAFEAKKAKVENIARVNANTAFDQVGDYPSLQEAIDSHDTNVMDTLHEEGFTNDPDYNYLFNAASRAFDAEVKKLKGEQVGSTTLETIKAKPEKQKTKPTGRKPEAPEVREKKSKAKKEVEAAKDRADYSVEQVLPELENYSKPLDTSEAVDEEAAKNMEANWISRKRELIKRLMTHYNDSRIRGSEAWKRVRDALNHPSITEKERTDIAAGLKIAQKPLKQSAAPVGKADRGFSRVANAAQALTRIIKTGTIFERLIASRLRGYVNGVKFVVIEVGQELPEELQQHVADFDAARGLYVPDTHTVYVKGESYGNDHGVNNITVLHELLHAATNQKIALGLNALYRGFPDAKLTGFVKDLRDLGLHASSIYHALERRGKLSPELKQIVEATLEFHDDGTPYYKIFDEPQEFLAYGLTDPEFQRFLKAIPSTKKEANGFGEFVRKILKIFNVGPENYGALHDLIDVTDKILDAKKTPLMRLVEYGMPPLPSALPKNNAAPANLPADKVTELNKLQDIEIQAKKTLENFDKTKSVYEKAKQAQLFYTITHDPSKILPVLWGITKTIPAATLKRFLRAPTTDMIAGWGGHHITSILEVNKLLQQLGGTTKLHIANGVKVASQVSEIFRKNPELRSKIEKLALATTIDQINPSDRRAKERSPTYDKMYRELGPEGQKAYKLLTGYYEDVSDLKNHAFEEQIQHLKIDPTIKKNMMLKIRQIFEGEAKLDPYLPLMRHGEYWIRMGKGDGRVSTMFPTMAERDAVKADFIKSKARTEEELINSGELEHGDEAKTLRTSMLNNDDSGLLKELFNVIDSTVNGSTVVDGNYEDVNNELKDAAFQLYLRMLPEGAMRKQFLHRQGVAGYDPDVLKNFAESVLGNSTVLARMEHAPQLRAALSGARAAARSTPYMPFVAEMEKRVEQELAPRSKNMADAVANFLTQASYITYLSGASTALIQPVSIIQMAIPILGARHGYTKLAYELGKFSHWGEYSITKPDGSLGAPSILNSKHTNANADERKALKAMLGRDVTESTLTNAIHSMQNVPTEELGTKWYKTKQGAKMLTFGLLHATERVPREIVFLASYRLSRKAGKSHEFAIDQAVQDTNDSFGNYASYNQSPITKIPGGKIALQFSMYPLHMTSMLLKNFTRMIPLLNKEGKWEAFKILGGIVGSTGLLAGAVGLPMFSIVMGMMGGFWDDHKDDMPAELQDLDYLTWWTRVHMPEVFGGKTFMGMKVSDILLYGVPTAMTGEDFSTKFGLNDMWFRDVKATRTEREELIAYAIQKAGPAINMILNWADGAQAMVNGDVEKAAEKIMPAGIRNLVLTHKYATEGAKNVKGDEILTKDEYTTGMLVYQALGFKSAELSHAQDLAFKLAQLDQQIKFKRQDLVTNLKTQYRKEDAEAYDKLDDERLKFNARYPKYKLTQDEVRTSIKADEKASAEAVRGIRTNKQNQELFAPALFPLMDDK